MTGFAGRKGLSGSALKWIAIAAMFLDHIGAVLIERNIWPMMLEGGAYSFLGQNFESWYRIDLVLRYIGRIGFPLFAFLLVEGFLHTRDVKKYALRLGAFALLSELPFDLALNGAVLEFGYQNVFFTLLLGLLAVWSLQKGEESVSLWGWLGVLGAGAAAYALHTDYGALGVLFVVLLYLFRYQPWPRAVFGSLLLVWGYGGIEVTGALAFFFLIFYNGTRGKQNRYFFYLFYPAHLLVLWAAGRYLLPLLG